MRILLLPCLFAGLLLTAGCDKSTDPEPEPEPVICWQDLPVKTVADQQGTVRFNSTTKQYAIVVTRSDVTGSVDVGILVQTLPLELQADGLPVLFSGSYYRTVNGPTSGDVSEYVLLYTKVVAKQ